MYQQLAKFSAATLHEALGKTGNLPSAIKPIAPGMKICGPAYTVQTIPCDNKILHRAYAYAKPGDVLMAHCSDYYEAGYWGDLMSLGAKTKGIAGLVIDACVRDANDIEAMGFPVFSRGLCIRGTSSLEGGTLNQPIVIGGLMIHPRRHYCWRPRWRCGGTQRPYSGNHRQSHSPRNPRRIHPRTTPARQNIYSNLRMGWIMKNEECKMKNNLQTHIIHYPLSIIHSSLKK